MPCESVWAVSVTRQFLFDLLNPRKTPKVPRAVRKEAARCLRHYPGDYLLADVFHPEHGKEEKKEVKKMMEQKRKTSRYSNTND